MFLLMKEREREREGERERERDVGEKQQWVAFHTGPDWDSNPQPFGVQEDTAPN